MSKSIFDLHGIALAVEASSPVFEDAIRNLFWSFPAGEFTNQDSLSIELRSVSVADVASFLPPSGARIIYSRRAAVEEDPLDAGLEFDIFHSEGAVIVDLGEQGIISIDTIAGEATASLVHPEELHVDIVGSLLLFMLVELLKTRGVFMIHAATLEKDGMGVLVPGTRGRGKTTTCLTLVRGGFRFLSDDVSFFREGADGIELLAFPERVSVSDNTIAMIPELRDAGVTFDDGFLKNHFRIDDIFPGVRTDSCSPNLILFPNVVSSKDSRLEAVPRGRALEDLLPQGISVLDREAAKEQFRLLGRLVAESTCYKLYFGEDIDRLPERVSEALVRTPCPSD